MNAILGAGDPVLATTVTTGVPLPGPFAGQTTSCRTCHLVDEHGLEPRGGNRTYADFARRSPIPLREDGQTETVRNSPALVEVVRPGALLHADGEFSSAAALAVGTFTGRNFGWLPAERGLAVAHVAAVIRGDDGRGPLARAFGGPYRAVLAGRSPTLRLPQRFRLDVNRATDDEILRVVGRLVAAYLGSLRFARDDEGHFDGSPFDRFLEVNGLARDPEGSPLAYSRFLRAQVEGFLYLLPVIEGRFALHDQAFRFGPRELQGLRIFLREPGGNAPERGGVGNCIACHPAPVFTDFAFHNTGVSQDEYDRTHGTGTFAALAVPALGARASDPERFLPASPRHPAGLGLFRAVPSAAAPERVDLGLWNVFANPDLAGPRFQRRLDHVACRALGRAECRARRGDRARLLEGTVGLFKTPGLRDLGHSGPYLHDGSRDTLEDVLRFYLTVSARARAGDLRNASPELAGIRLTEADVEPLAAFLRALDEDYE